MWRKVALGIVMRIDVTHVVIYSASELQNESDVCYWRILHSDILIAKWLTSTLMNLGIVVVLLQFRRINRTADR